MARQEIVHANCIEYMQAQPEESFDVVVTSPPYNLAMEYGSYDDDRPRDAYLGWTEAWVQEVRRVLRPDGSFFLNVGSSSNDPWIATDVSLEARKFFVLQNRIVWAKSICVGDESHGHFKPRNSYRYLNSFYEEVFHFTHHGKVAIDRLAVGVPFADKSNIARWGHARDRRCRGNIWFLPYRTIQNKAEKGHHPAIFPVELPEFCIKLHGVDRASVVYDPFGGTGTTAVAALRLGLNAVCTELDEDYCRAAQARLEKEKDSSPGPEVPIL